MHPVPRIIPAILLAVAMVACREDSTSPVAPQGAASTGVTALASYSLPIALPMLPGSTHGTANGINDGGSIVGTNNVGNTRPVKWVGTTVFDLGIPKGDEGAIPDDINNGGTIVGHGFNINGTHALRWSGTQITILPGLPGAKYGYAVGINDAGTIVGHSWPKTSHAVRWDPNGKLTDLQPVGAYSSAAFDINGSGYVVGTVRTDSKVANNRAYLWYPGGGGAYLSPQWGEAYGVNDSLVVTGIATDPATGKRSAFTWSPAGGLHFIPGAIEGSGYAVSITGRVAGTLSPSSNAAFTAAFNAPAQQLSGQYAEGTDLNRCGIIVGYLYEFGVVPAKPVKWIPRTCEA